MVATLMVKGTDNKPEYMVVAAKGGVCLSIKPLAGILKPVPEAPDTYVVMLGIRVRGSVLPEDWGKAKVPEVMSDNYGKLAMKTFPLMTFSKYDEKRASFERVQIVGTTLSEIESKFCNHDKHYKVLLPAITDMLKCVEDFEEKVKPEDVALWLTTEVVSAFTKDVSALVKPAVSVVHEGNVALVDFSKKK